jgi:hypothetical protein
MPPNPTRVLTIVAAIDQGVVKALVIALAMIVRNEFGNGPKVALTEQHHPEFQTTVKSLFC